MGVTLSHSIRSCGPRNVLKCMGKSQREVSFGPWPLAAHHHCFCRMFLWGKDYATAVGPMRRHCFICLTRQVLTVRTHSAISGCDARITSRSSGRPKERTSLLVLVVSTVMHVFTSMLRIRNDHNPRAKSQRVLYTLPPKTTPYQRLSRAYNANASTRYSH